MNIWLAIVLTLIAATAVGFLNGYMVMTTKLPSFIVTLAHVLHPAGRQPRRDQGHHRPGGGQRASTRAPGYDSANKIFGGSFWSPHDFRITVLWWIAITVAGHLGARAHPRRATGSSASAATPTRPATSASRSRASRSACS